MKLSNLEGTLIDSISISDDEVVIHARNPRRSANCPHCGRRTTRLHQKKSRRVIHDSHNDRTVVLRLTGRRFMCRNCRKPFTERNIPDITNSQFSEHFKQQVVRVVKTVSFEEASRRYQVSVPTVVKFLRQKKQNFSLPAGIMRLGVDAHSFSGRDMKTTIGDIESK